MAAVMQIAVPLRVEEVKRFRLLPQELASTHRILERWATSSGEGLPSEMWDDRPKSRAPPLDDGTAMVVDRIICMAPPQTKKFIVLWYKTPQPISLIARKLHIRAENTYKAWGVILYYMRWRFQESKYSDLLTLLKKDCRQPEFGIGSEP